jgi:hypothetical protein
LGDVSYPWLGIQQLLQEGERNYYLTSLGLSSPLLIQDFWIGEECRPRAERHSKAVCILFNEILLFCRFQAESSLTLWDHTPGSSRIVSTNEKEKLFVYGHLYPRHIHGVNLTGIGDYLSNLG